MAQWYRENVSEEFLPARNEIVRILREESSLMDIVKLIGADVLPEDQKLILEIARVIRIGILQQNAYHMNDTYVPLSKQFMMIKVVLYLYEKCRKLVGEEAIPVSLIRESGIFETVIKIKYDIENDKPEKFDDIFKQIDELKF